MDNNRIIILLSLLGVGFIFIHSTLLTRATLFAHKARGAAMSLVAFCFMGGGGVGTALGGKIASVYGFSRLFLIYGPNACCHSGGQFLVDPV